MNKRLLVLVLVACIALLGALQLDAGVVPGHSNAFGKSLGDWMKLYWTWALGGDQEGNVKKVVFLPLPAAEPASEECPFVLVGEEDVTLQTGEKFILPMFVYIGEVYDNGYEEDPADIPAELFTGANVLITLDGVPIIDSEVDDLSEFFFEAQYFDPAIDYGNDPEPGEDPVAIGAIWVKGIGFAHTPLPKGEHTLTLFVDTFVELDPDNFPGCTLTFINTWNVTVE